MTQSTQGGSDSDQAQILCNEGTTPVMGPRLNVASVYGPSWKVKQVTHVHLRKRGKGYSRGTNLDLFSCSASCQRCLRMRKERNDQEEVGNRSILS